jgi:hypothetical protein
MHRLAIKDKAKGNRPKRGERSMGTPNRKKVPELHHENVFSEALKACSGDGLLL